MKSLRINAAAYKRLVAEGADADMADANDDGTFTVQIDDEVQQELLRRVHALRNLEDRSHGDIVEDVSRVILEA